MIVKAIKTDVIKAGVIDLDSLLDKAIGQLEDGCVVAITSKIVSLCENNVVPFGQQDKEKLVIQESDLYLPASLSKYQHHFTITDNTLIALAGIDESNGNGNYVLWPKDAQKTANQVRAYLKERFHLDRVGVIITDSTSQPLRRGSTGITLAHSGFSALNDYIGKPDLFGRPFTVSLADVADGLAAAAVLQMGEGRERTPIAILSDLPFVEFQNHDPKKSELKKMTISLADDLFGPFLSSVKWQKGQRK
ncbi:MAG TPA: coenzyme F420-0:L-glutamate ligase [Patescibacteria group bacterium]|jgi:putative folate metabolism gamma-glutamate ligase|nr:coenzyme F420-0:L-glutamate ligase [Patescibacteria group bacterium]